MNRNCSCLSTLKVFVKKFLSFIKGSSLILNYIRKNKSFPLPISKKKNLFREIIKRKSLLPFLEHSRNNYRLMNHISFMKWDILNTFLS